MSEKLISFKPLGLVEKVDRFVGQKVIDWLHAVLENVPPNFKPRKHGPVLVLPMFIQDIVSAYYGPGEGRVERQMLGRQVRLTRFKGYEVFPGYEPAVIIFYPEQGGINSRAVFRQDIENFNQPLLPG